MSKNPIINSIISIEQMFVNEKKNKFSRYFLEILLVGFTKTCLNILTLFMSFLFPLAPPCEENLARSTTAQSAHAIRPQHHRARNTHTHTQHTHTQSARATPTRNSAHATSLTQHRTRNIAHATLTQRSRTPDAKKRRICDAFPIYFHIAVPTSQRYLSFVS